MQINRKQRTDPESVQKRLLRIGRGWGISALLDVIHLCKVRFNTKYFVKKEEQKTFEETHNVVVTYKNPNCNLGWNHDRNIQGLNDIRNEFIKESFYNDQEEVVAQLIKKYPNR